MTTLIVEHRVADYATWRPVYDSVDALRASHGVSSHRVWQTADDPNVVVVEHVFPDAGSARALLGNPGLGEAMGRAGVVRDSVRTLILEDAV